MLVVVDENPSCIAQIPNGDVCDAHKSSPSALSREWSIEDYLIVIRQPFAVDLSEILCTHTVYIA